jgi:hypothetical protein
MQIFDSWGSTEEMSTSDSGAIYHQWIDNRGIGGSAPRVNAARQPGEWQSYFLNLKLEGSHPEPIAGAVRPDRVIAASTVSHRVLARRPPLVAPLHFEAQMVVLVLRARDQTTVDLTGDPNRRRAVRRDDAKDAARVAVHADRFGVLAVRVLLQSRHVARPMWTAEVGVPTGKIVPVPERRPGIRLSDLDPVDGERNGGERFQRRSAIDRRSLEIARGRIGSESSPHRVRLSESRTGDPKQLLIVRELGVNRLLYLAETRPDLLLDRIHVRPQCPRAIQRLAFVRR